MSVLSGVMVSGDVILVRKIHEPPDDVAVGLLVLVHVNLGVTMVTIFTDVGLVGVLGLGVVRVGDLVVAGVGDHLHSGDQLVVL